MNEFICWPTESMALLRADEDFHHFESLSRMLALHSFTLAKLKETTGKHKNLLERFVSNSGIKASKFGREDRSITSISMVNLLYQPQKDEELKSILFFYSVSVI